MKNDEKLTPNTQHTESKMGISKLIIVLDKPLNHLTLALAFFTDLVHQASISDLTGPLRRVTVIACSDGWKPRDILLRAMLFDAAPLCLPTPCPDRVVCQAGRGHIKNIASTAS